MQIISYVELTPAQIRAVTDFETVVVRTVLTRPSVMATFKTFQGQAVKIMIDQYGCIQEVELDQA